MHECESQQAGIHKFWMCYVEGKTTGPAIRHPCESSARQEAERLAQLPDNRGKRVYILESIAWCEVAAVAWHDCNRIVRVG